MTEYQCFVCKEDVERAIKRRPKVGTLAVCSCCTAVNVVMRGGKLGAPTADELAQGMRDPKLAFYAKVSVNDLWKVGRYYGFC